MDSFNNFKTCPTFSDLLTWLFIISKCSTPFELHDDSYVLKAMGLCERGQHDGAPEPSSNGGDCSSMSGMYQHHTSQGSMSSSMGKMITSPPKPGILKARVKNEH